MTDIAAPTATWQPAAESPSMFLLRDGYGETLDWVEPAATGGWVTGAGMAGGVYASAVAAMEAVDPHP